VLAIGVRMIQSRRTARLNESPRRHYEFSSRVERTLVQLEAAAVTTMLDTVSPLVQSDRPPRFAQGSARR